MYTVKFIPEFQRWVVEGLAGSRTHAEFEQAVAITDGRHPREGVLRLSSVHGLMLYGERANTMPTSELRQLGVGHARKVDALYAKRWELLPDGSVARQLAPGVFSRSTP